MRLLGLFSLLASGFFALGSGGGSGGGSSGITPYSPTGLASADQTWQNLLAGQVGVATSPSLYGAIQPQLGPLYQQLVGNLGQQAPGIENAANTMAPYYGNMASQADAFHNLMSTQGTQDYSNANALTTGGAQVMNTAMDPLNAVYNNLLNQTNQQSAASSSERGIGMSPESAGLQNQADQNLNLAWQQQQLQNQISGLSAMGTADTQAGIANQQGSAQLTGSQEMSALAPQLYMQGAQLPYQTTAGLINQGLTNADTYASTINQTQMSPLSGIMSEIIPYMNYGAGAQSNAFNAGQTNLSNLTSLLGLGGGAAGGLSGLSSLFGAGGLSGLFGGSAGAAGAASGAGLLSGLSSDVLDAFGL